MWQDGELKEIAVTPPVRNHRVASLEDLILLAAEAADGKLDGLTAAKPVVWHDAGAVRLTLDDADRRDGVTFKLTRSAEFQRLQAIDECPEPMDQRQFVRNLRIMLGQPELMAIPFRKLDWKTGMQASGEVLRGRESLGKQVEAQVQGVQDLPEELTIQIPIYREEGERRPYDCRCAVDIDVSMQRLTLIPFPNQIEDMIDRHQADIRSRLEGALRDKDPKVPIYYGTP